MKSVAAIGLVAVLFAPSLCADARGFSGGGARAGGFSGSRGGFDMHSEAPGGYSHSSTGPGGTARTTNVSGSAGDYNRTTNASNGNYNRTATGGVSGSTYSHGATTNTAYGTHSSGGSYNAQTGSYNRGSSGSNAYGSYSAGTSGNAYSHTASHYANGTNAYGQTYSSAAYKNNGYVYRGATVSNPVYAGYGAWGWNAGTVWAPVPYYWGGGFWGPYAWGAASAIAFGYYTTPSNTQITSYQVESTSPGAKLLSSYHLTQVPCGPANLVVIMGSNNSVICATPNGLVSAGTYGVDEQTLTLTSITPK